MTAQALVDELVTLGVELVASLPDSWLRPVLDACDRHDAIRHVRVTREDEGVAIVAGAHLGGGRAVLVCQNAGLLLSANALAGYGSQHGLPVPVIAAMRGGPDDGYFYQAYKGRVTTKLLDAIEVPHFAVDVPGRAVEAARVVEMASLHRRPAVALMSRAALSGGPS